MIELNDLITSSGKYKDRAESVELTDELKANGEALLVSVNALLTELGILESEVSSGFRPLVINKNIANAAKASLHMKCRAIDLVDDHNQSLANLIASKPELLIKHGLWLENPSRTKGKSTNWVHLDNSEARLARKIRIFKP